MVTALRFSCKDGIVVAACFCVQIALFMYAGHLSNGCAGVRIILTRRGAV